jgi:hypothetical protein
VGVPSSSAGPNDNKEPGAYNLYRIDGEPGRWTCEMVVRGFKKGDPGIIERRRLMLLDPAASRTVAAPGLTV